MSDLIPSVSWDAFVEIVRAGKIRELKACEVVTPDGYIFTAIIPHGDMMSGEYVRTQAEYLSLKANIVGGKDVEEIIVDTPASPVDYRIAALAKARAARKQNRERVDATV